MWDLELIADFGETAEVEKDITNVAYFDILGTYWLQCNNEFVFSNIQKKDLSEKWYGESCDYDRTDSFAWFDGQTAKESVYLYYSKYGIFFSVIMIFEPEKQEFIDN